jgi:hypothetical protein
MVYVPVFNSHVCPRRPEVYVGYLRINLVIIYTNVIHLQLKPHKVLYKNSKAVERMMKYVTSLTCVLHLYKPICRAKRLVNIIIYMHVNICNVVALSALENTTDDKYLHTSHYATIQMYIVGAMLQTGR